MTLAQESDELVQKIATAVEFLIDVSKKGHKEEVLRKYLLDRQDLSQTQVDVAFRIYHKRAKSITAKSRSDKPNDSGIVSTTPGMTAPGMSENISAIQQICRNGKAERPEVSISKSHDSRTSPSFLLENHEVIGKKHIRDFLHTELNYCGILECLWNVYYKVLHDLADQKKISLKQVELKEIFRRIPELMNFHKIFYENLMKQTVSIGQIFMHNINHFKEYLDYMNDCNYLITKMREHIHDKKLHRILDQIREKSRRKNDDFVDLLLVPLDRIMDYSEFLEQLLIWANKEHTEYNFLDKATRRIGRIVKNIENHKYEIKNSNEMNKIQQFIGTQCDIFTPNRRVVRRGLMIRRTTTWPTRKKHYVFFLFTDVLLWTTRKGELQNAVHLRNCQVINSDAKTNHERKFKILASGQNGIQKVLLLECNSQRQRNWWYSAVEEQIKNAKMLYKAKDGIKPVEEDFAEFLANNTTTEPKSRLSGQDIPALSSRHDDRSPATSIEDEDISLRLHERYEHSENFPKYSRSDNVTMVEDTISCSENDQDLSSNLDCSKNYGSSLAVLFPNMISRNKSEEEKTVQSRVNHRNVDSLSYNFGGSAASNIETLPKKDKSSKDSTPEYSQEEGLMPSNSSKVSGIIRTLKEQGKRSSQEDIDTMLEQASAFTIRLTDFI